MPSSGKWVETERIQTLSNRTPGTSTSEQRAHLLRVSDESPPHLDGSTHEQPETSRDLDLSDPATFLREYQDNIRHGGLFLTWQPAPAVHTPVHIRLLLPLGLSPITLPAQVVFTNDQGAGLQLQPLSDSLAQQLEACFHRCETHRFPRPGRNRLPERRVQFDSPQEFLRMYESDLKHGGMFLRWSDGPPVDTELRVWLHIPMGADLFCVDARVVHQNSQGVGVQFTGLTPEKRTTLHQYVERCQYVTQSLSVAPPPAPWTALPLPSTPPSSVPLKSPTPASAPSDPGLPVLRVPQHEPTPAQTTTASTPDVRPGSPPPTRPAHDPLTEDPQHLDPSPSPSVDTGPARAVKVIWEGNIGTPTLESVVLTLAKQHATGALVLHHQELRRELFFQSGYVTQVIETPPMESHLLGQVMVMQGLIRPADLDSLCSGAQAESMLFGQYLIREGCVTAQQLAQSLLRQNQVKVWDALQLPEGRFAFHENARAARRSMNPAANPLHVIFREKSNVFRTHLSDTSDAHINPVLDRYVHRQPDAPEDLSVYGLNDEEQRFWNLIVIGQYSIRECFQVSPMSRMRTYATLFTMLELDLIRLESDMSLKWKIVRLREQYEHKIARISRGTLFSALDLHWSSSEEEIEEAVKRMHQEFDCSQHNFALPEDVVNMSKYILQRADEAHKLLSSYEQRVRYRATFIEPSQLHFSAELLHQQGDMLFYRNQLREALGAYVRALELEPGDLELRRKVLELRTRSREGRLP